MLNGLKRSSLVLEPGSKDIVKQGVTKQTSQEGKKSSTSSSSSSLSAGDQSSKDALSTGASVGSTTQTKLLPQLV